MMSFRGRAGGAGGELCYTFFNITSDFSDSGGTGRRRRGRGRGQGVRGKTVAECLGERGARRAAGPTRGNRPVPGRTAAQGRARRGDLVGGGAEAHRLGLAAAADRPAAETCSPSGGGSSCKRSLRGGDGRGQASGRSVDLPGSARLSRSRAVVGPGPRRASESGGRLLFVLEAGAGIG